MGNLAHERWLSEREQHMFKIAHVNKAGIKRWFNHHTESWCENLYDCTGFDDIQECLDVLNELRYDMLIPLYIAITSEL